MAPQSDLATPKLVAPVLWWKRRFVEREPLVLNGDGFFLKTDSGTASPNCRESHFCPGLDTAEESGLGEGSIDLIIVAQALHWFDLPRFYTEAVRVLKPGGVLAAWCYGIVTMEDEAVDAVVQHFYREVVGPYWPAERHHVETGYQELAFPFAQVDAPEFWIEVHWSLTELLGYLRSWSATARYSAAIGSDPVSALEGALKPFWGEPTKAKRITWPLAVRVGVM